MEPVEPLLTSKVGPWGQLESRTVYLEPPESLLAVVAKPSTVTRWTFEQTTAHAVREVLTKAKVPEAVIERLLSPVRLVNSGNSVILLPEAEDLTVLSFESRSALYLELAKYAANEYQRDPVFILGGDVDDWMQGASLTPAQQALFRRLLWKRGGATVFSDVQALLGLAKTPDEVLRQIDGMTQGIMKIAEFQARLIKAGFDPVLGLGPPEAVRYIADDYARWEPIVKKLTQH